MSARNLQPALRVQRRQFDVLQADRYYLFGRSGHGQALGLDDFTLLRAARDLAENDAYCFAYSIDIAAETTLQTLASIFRAITDRPDQTVKFLWYAQGCSASLLPVDLIVERDLGHAYLLRDGRPIRYRGPLPSAALEALAI